MINDLVSVIMPSWNTGRFIGQSIQSVLNQTYPKWELIIVDDCSSDNTDQIVSTYNDPRIKYKKNAQNMGAALTRNCALKEAQGEWIAFLDSDDIWMPTKLEKQIVFMKKHCCVLSYHEYEKIDESGNSLNVLVSAPSIINAKKIYHYDYIGHLTMMYSAKEFGLIQIKDIKKNNDYAIRLQLFKHKGTRGFLLKENLAKYRVRKKSISHDKVLKKIKSHYDLFHFCDERNMLFSILHTFFNLFFGSLKKIQYESNIQQKQIQPNG